MAFRSEAGFDEGESEEGVVVGEAEEGVGESEEGVGAGVGDVADEAADEAAVVSTVGGGDSSSAFVVGEQALPTNPNAKAANAVRVRFDA